MTSTPTPHVVSRPVWLPHDEYPFQIRSMDLTAGAVSYIDEGSGPTLLFVHTGMWSFVFRDAIARLRPDFRCITLDFPGYGLSPEPSEAELGLAAQGELLAEFVAHLGLADITLVLHDLGGVVGTAFAAAHPRVVNGFVMANTFAWKPEGKALVRMLRIVSSRPLTAFDKATRFIPRFTTSKAGVGRHLSKAGKRAFLGPFAQRRRVERFHTLMKDALAERGLYDKIEHATAGPLKNTPVLTIFGERNDPFGFQQRHHDTFPNHRSLVIANGNHFPMLDDPDQFADEVRAWHHSVSTTDLTNDGSNA